MKIKEKLSQHRRDFTAIYECENCGHEVKSTGYDDSHFHNEVIPKMKCPKCGKSSNDMGIKNEPMATRYPDGMDI